MRYRAFLFERSLADKLATGAPLKTKSKGKSKNVAKPKHAPTAVITMNALQEESDVDPAVLDGPVVGEYSHT